MIKQDGTRIVRETMTKRLELGRISVTSAGRINVELSEGTSMTADETMELVRVLIDAVGEARANVVRNEYHGEEVEKQIDPCEVCADINRIDYQACRKRTGNDRMKVMFKAKFCPNCGRRLP